MGVPAPGSSTLNALHHVPAVGEARAPARETQ